MNRTGNISGRNIIYSLTLGWVLIMLPLTFITLKKTWYRILPDIAENVKVLKKGPILASEYVSDNVYENKLKPVVTFELMSKRMLTFEVSRELYCSIEENETGLLTYKEQDKHLYFVGYTKH